MCLDAITLFFKFFGPRYVDLEVVFVSFAFLWTQLWAFEKSKKADFHFWSKTAKKPYFEIAEKSKNGITP